MQRIGRCRQQVHGFHDALVVVKRHHHGVCTIAAADDGPFGIFMHRIENGLQRTARFGLGDDFHSLRSFDLYLNWCKFKAYRVKVHQAL